MKCPACRRALLQTRIGSVVLDACHDGCGGVWLDKVELEKVNAENPRGAMPLEIARHPDSVVNESSPRSCPRCEGQRLEHRLFSLGTGVVMDCCPACGGLWLDHGELETIREETNPVRQPNRVASRTTRPPSSAQKIQINFGVLEQVQRLSVSKSR